MYYGTCTAIILYKNLEKDKSNSDKSNNSL